MLSCQRRELPSLSPHAASARALVRANPMQTGVAFSFLRVRTSTLSADGDVSAKLAEELVYEKEAAIEGEPEFLKEFRNSGIWTVCSFFFFYGVI